MKAIFYLQVIPFLICLGCLNAKDAAVTADMNDINSLVAGNAKFAFDLYDKLKHSPDITKLNGNIFFSPYSISTALGMTYAGARGETQKQMETALHFPFTDNKLHETFGALQRKLNQEDKSFGYQILSANAVWSQKGEPISKEFLDLANNYYEAGFSLLDFVNETEKSRQIINSWVEEKTINKIKDLIPPGGVDEKTVLVLTNAVYFQGDWMTKFEKNNTRQEDFTISVQKKIKVDMMHVESDFKYYSDDNLQAIELPYKGNKISMLVFLPIQIEGLSEIEKMLTTEILNTVISKMKKEKVSVYLPKFKILWGTYSLNRILIELGIADAFDFAKADFSGINGKAGIYISDVLHQAFIEVNEKGTEAAAATGVTFKQIVGNIFYADHPFVFMIRDNRSGTILFMGRIINPAE